jgi:hypothetical protein
MWLEKINFSESPKSGDLVLLRVLFNVFPLRNSQLYKRIRSNNKDQSKSIVSGGLKEIFFKAEKERWLNTGARK